ncbi:MAG: hypothetical protein JRH04_14675 [Deltaproteobacteria bacterium]|nr:hypothetical protein [Deltaproteobacteria bacterium]
MSAKNRSSQGKFACSPKNKTDIFLTGGRVLNVYSGELLKMNVAIKQDRIWYVGPSSHVVSEDTQVLDVGNKVLVPFSPMVRLQPRIIWGRSVPSWDHHPFL